MLNEVKEIINQKREFLESTGDYFAEMPYNVNLETLRIIPYGDFTSKWYQLGLTAKQFKSFKIQLRKNPNEGWAIPRGAEGVSVSDAWVSEVTIPQGNVIRAVYTYIHQANTFFCLLVYSHITLNGVRGQKDLTLADKKYLNECITKLKQEYSKRGGK